MPKPDLSWLSVSLCALGVLCIGASGVTFFTGGSGFLGALCGLAIGAIFFALGHMLEYLQDIRQRLRRIEERSASDANDCDDSKA